MEIGKNFASIEYYNNQMSKGLEDKLYFLEHLPKNKEYIFVDAGCADGTLINMVRQKLGDDHQYVGYDISENMIDLAKSKMIESPVNVTFTSNWEDVSKLLSYYKQYTKVVILSSVIHEVYSYTKSSQEVVEFWDHVIHSNFDYICIRDMMVSEDIAMKYIPAGLQYVVEDNGKRTITIERFKQFVNRWGDLSRGKNFLHFLLKYRWQINWDKELNENYFPIYIEELLKLCSIKYNLEYFQRFRVPFLDECIKKDLKIDPVKDNIDPTHIKAIFKKKNNYE